MTTRISMWSGPRNLSTALMYAFRQRSDTTVLDEPLYGHYLARTGTMHPMREETIAAMETEADAAVATLRAPVATEVVFLKNMAHHTTGISLAQFEGFKNALLTRHPAAVLMSLTKQYPDAKLEHTGLPHSIFLLDWMIESGQDPVVLEAGEILKNPRAVLGQWCDRTGLPFEEAMLSWPTGPKPEDGVWAPAWYDGVHASTGFGPYNPPPKSVPEHLTDLLAECMPLYERLMAHALVA